MELRRFGRYKKRTWYVHKSLMKQDYLVILSAILILGISIGLIFFNHGRFIIHGDNALSIERICH